MTPLQTERIEADLADVIYADADDIVEEWMEWIIHEVSLRPARMLPREAIRDHIPQVVQAIAESLRGPTESVASYLDALKTHARLRRDQGYDIEELLKEYHGLTGIIGERMLARIASYPEPADPLSVGKVFLRLSRALSSVSDLTVSLYRDTEVRHNRELRRQLEHYVDTLTHELRQPLQSITAGTGMLEVESVATQEDQRDRYVRMIRDGIERSGSLIDEIRMLVLFEGAQQQEAWRPLEASVQLVLREMEEKARRYEVRIDVEQPLPRIEVHATRVEVTLMNLVSNAIKYSDPEKPERWVRISSERAGPEEACRWEVRVTDNGLGIPRVVQGQIFERHFRAHPDVVDGTGLGLAITRRILEQAGGDIWFESEEGEGSTFCFVIPARVDPSATEEEGC